MKFVCQPYVAHSVNSTVIRIIFLGDCRDLESPEHGSVQYNGVHPGSEASFFCNRLYKLNGSQYRTCQNIGEWSGTEPTCYRKFYWVSEVSLLQTCSSIENMTHV